MKISESALPSAHRSSARARAGACFFVPLVAVFALLPGAQGHAESLVPPGPEPVLHLTARAFFDAARARAGDTVRYTVRVEWPGIPAAVMFHPPGGELEAPGFAFAGRSALHRRTEGADPRNSTEFVYTLVARDPGKGRIPGFALRYHNGVSRREEALLVPAAFLEVLPARAPWWRGRAPLAGLALLVLAGVAAAAFGLARRARGSGRAGAVPARRDEGFEAALRELKSRCATADSRTWFRDAERLCVRFLCRRLGLADTGQVRFEAALDQYLARPRTAEPGEAEGWATLRDLFHEARYAGASREPHELRETCRHLDTCLHPEGDRPA